MNNKPQSSGPKKLLEESEARYQLLINSVKDYAIFMLDPQGYISTWNAGAEKLKGYSKEEIIHQHFSIFYPTAAAAAHYPDFELAKALENGKFEDEGWRIRKDGSQFWANVTIAPIYNHKNQHIGFTKITRDLSERIKNETLMRKNKELHQVNTDLDNFIYTASHDLKAPITNLEGLLSLVERIICPKLNETEKQIIEKMGTSLSRLQSTIESLIEVTKAQKNLEEVKEVVSFKEVLEEVKEEISPLIMSSNAIISENLQVQELIFAKANLRSILYNLLSNAVKYRSPERQIEVEVATYKEEGQIVVSVRDNGLGLSETQQAKLFTMFKRFHRDIEGTGIGLYIVKRVIENYGGKIQVKSKLNEGTEFKLYFNLF
jgi:PAS domain S-box-containing protein